MRTWRSCYKEERERCRLCQALSLVLFHFDLETAGHCHRVGKKLERVFELGALPFLDRFSENERESFVCGAYFHDFGKIFLNQRILKKRAPLDVGQVRTILTRLRVAADQLGIDWKRAARDVIRLNSCEAASDPDLIQRLSEQEVCFDGGKKKLLLPWEYRKLTQGKTISDAEFRHIQQHPVLGYEYFVKLPPFQDPLLLDAIKLHHEKKDGSGYPCQIKAPKHVQVLGLIDIMDALINPRCYKRPLSHKQAKKIVLSMSGKLFDSKIVDVVLETYKPPKMDTSLFDAEAASLGEDVKLSV